MNGVSITQTRVTLKIKMWPSIDYLEHVILSRHRKIASPTTDANYRLRPRTNCMQLRSLKGRCNVCREFDPTSLKSAAPLNKITTQRPHNKMWFSKRRKDPVDRHTIKCIDVAICTSIAKLKQSCNSTGHRWMQRSSRMLTLTTKRGRNY